MVQTYECLDGEVAEYAYADDRDEVIAHLNKEN
jgi:hypothetical protein